MLQITDRATDHLIQLRRSHRLDRKAMPRFSRRAGRLGLAFATTPADGDRLVRAGRVSALVAADAVATLDAALIDVRTKDGQTYLVAHRQREAAAPRPARTSPKEAAG